MRHVENVLAPNTYKIVADRIMELQSKTEGWEISMLFKIQNIELVLNLLILSMIFDDELKETIDDILTFILD